MRVFVHSEGCSANFAEGEMIAGLLSQKHEIVNSVAGADCVIMNICTVKGDSRAVKEVEEIKSEFKDKKIVLTGCVTDKVIKQLPDISVVTTNNIDKIEFALESKVVIKEKENLVKLSLPRIRHSPIIGIVPICSGCLDACAYCSTKLSKGNLFSYPEDKIIDEVKQCLKDGCKEIWITGQDTCCYGFDSKTNLAELLSKIVQIEGDFRIRVGMGNPRHVKRFEKEFLEIIQHPKIFKFVHIPVQSGSNEVLKRMLRGHSVEDFEALVNKLRKIVPHITISTDLILGFPGETENEFLESVDLVKRIKPDVLNISRFAPRPNTKAFSMPDQIHGKVSKERSRVLTDVFRQVTANNKKKWLGWKGSIIIDEKRKQETSVGRNDSYIPVVVRGDFELGTILTVEVFDTTTHYLKAKVIKQ